MKLVQGLAGGILGMAGGLLIMVLALNAFAGGDDEAPRTAEIEAPATLVPAAETAATIRVPIP